MLKKVKEEWRPVVGYFGFYEVSNLGKVRSLDRTCINRLGKVRKLKGITLSPACNGSGYLFVGLRNHAVGKQISVHRLVCRAFNGSSNGLPNVNHKNGIKSDNRASNLEWCTRSHNIQHALNTGLKPRGTNINTNILSEQEVLDICRLLDTTDMPYSEIAAKYGVKKDTIGAINLGRNWNWLTNRKKQ